MAFVDSGSLGSLCTCEQQFSDILSTSPPLLNPRFVRQLTLDTLARSKAALIQSESRPGPERNGNGALQNPGDPKGDKAKPRVVSFTNNASATAMSPPLPPLRFRKPEIDETDRRVRPRKSLPGKIRPSSRDTTVHSSTLDSSDAQQRVEPADTQGGGLVTNTQRITSGPQLQRSSAQGGGTNLADQYTSVQRSGTGRPDPSCLASETRATVAVAAPAPAPAPAPASAPTSKFIKVPVDPPTPLVSQLSSHLRQSTTLTVYLPDVWSEPPRALQVKVFKSFTVEQVIGATLRLCENDPELPAAGMMADDFDLRYAEDDGLPDTDLPALSRQQEIRQFATPGAPHLALAIKTSGGPSHSFVRRFKSGSAGSEILLCVTVETRVKCTLNLAFPRGATLRNVLLRINQKLRMFFSCERYVFRSENQQGVVETLDFERTLGSLDTFDLMLSEKAFADNPSPTPTSRASRSEMSPCPEEPAEITTTEEDFFFSEATASGYTEYTVYKIRANGRKDKRLMGVDREHVYNLMPSTDAKKGGVSFVKNLARAMQSSKTTTRRPSRRMSEIRLVELLPDKPGRFRIVYDEDRRVENMIIPGGTIYEFEAVAGPHVAAEIVAKLKYLMDLEAKMQQLVRKLT
eukprot:Rmarinus@m.15380